VRPGALGTISLEIFHIKENISDELVQLLRENPRVPVERLEEVRETFVPKILYTTSLMKPLLKSSTLSVDTAL
jgi:hypothetical protein